MTAARPAPRHIAAIHVLKARLHMSDGDYRSLLKSLTGKDSCKAMTERERVRVRQHMQRLAEGPGAQRLRPLERKVWALWFALGRAGALEAPAPAGLQAWVRRQLGVEHVRLCSDAQLHTLIESLKLWQQRAQRA